MHGTAGIRLLDDGAFVVTLAIALIDWMLAVRSRGKDYQLKTCNLNVTYREIAAPDSIERSWPASRGIADDHFCAEAAVRPLRADITKFG